ncbi:MAG: hypothetical protein K6T66_05190 [Peptococcaceae bacterium]|nr:hypothetical protein [Peptococcaceae bacterium]
MFRIGLKKEEKEIIVRTINELQELRAELSFFKNTLAGIISAERTLLPDRADTAEGGGETADPAPACTEANIREHIPHAPDSGDEVETGPVREQQDGPAAGSGEGEAEFAGPEKAGTIAGREWAVVNLFERKKPWWKFWQDGRRAGRKTV